MFLQRCSAGIKQAIKFFTQFQYRYMITIIFPSFYQITRDHFRRFALSSILLMAWKDYFLLLLTAIRSQQLWDIREQCPVRLPC